MLPFQLLFVIDQKNGLLDMIIYNIVLYVQFDRNNYSSFRVKSKI